MSIDGEHDLHGLRRVGRVVRAVLEETRRRVRPGVTTAELDDVAARVLHTHGARSAPVVEYGAPCSVFVSVDDEAVHGLPGPRRLRAGELVAIDMTAELDGYVADAALTVAVPPAPPAAVSLRDCAAAALRLGLEAAQPGARVSDVGRAVESEVERRGFSVLRELTGHGVGRAIHEPPTVPNWADPDAREVLHEGMVITVEPVVASGTRRVVDGGDGWTVRTANGSASAHAEHTVLIAAAGPVVLTA